LYKALKMRFYYFLLFVLICTPICSQEASIISQDITIDQHVDGTLLIANDIPESALVIIIPGSGPTDRNGNQNFLKNNSLKKLADALALEGISSFRYDKRIVKQIRQNNVDNDIMFDHFVDDAITVLKYFKDKYKFKKIFIAGHSQGSLVGMLAANEGADGFISIAGSGQPLDEILLYQINKTAPQFNEDTKRIISILKNGQTTDDYPQALASVFRKDIQLFIVNWMQYNPQEVIHTLNMPILIINGTKDLQVTVEEAKLLDNAAKNSTMIIVDNMNHVLVPIEGDDLENSKSYNESNREISPKIIEAIRAFVR